MVAVVTPLAKERKRARDSIPRSAVPGHGCQDEHGLPSRVRERSVADQGGNGMFLNAYPPTKEDRKKTTASPLSVLRDDGKAYARKLTEAGVDVTAVRVLATHHAFAMLNALAGTPA
jgi:acetyl esterase